MKDTKQCIIDEGTHLIQTRGYHAFSFQDISNKVGIKTASIHYHFPTKTDLAVAVVVSQKETTEKHLHNITSNGALTEREKIKLLCQSILATTYLSEEKMCLAGMLAIDILTLEPPVAQAVQNLIGSIEATLAKLISNGAKTNEFRRDIDAQSTATALMATIEGTLMLTRLFKDENRFTDAMDVIISRLL
ncbi:TetR/AcrR family transcriptional regulator [Candidatus Comchoanobacter bicostacola]|uniref:TetR/AcrR family transcriptional regulator n=1 Tax=Candidatus Comchoanobacter bicostacola TaxID=2919598 RepID=A0ABY5DLU8_9GAMM|nr:TetR/AcrR family transcriptional regulator [Candidatus Comchoanobacter bicostacola]UTC24717.1 TetR/AcrR family transcriptional regulator [Candidatus Comchoanobacter bicostacola]